MSRWNEPSTITTYMQQWLRACDKPSDTRGYENTTHASHISQRTRAAPTFARSNQMNIVFENGKNAQIEKRETYISTGRTPPPDCPGTTNTSPFLYLSTVASESSLWPVSTLSRWFRSRFLPFKLPT